MKNSLEKTSHKPTAILPNLGGSLPNEHMLAPVARDALRLMAGLMWDLGEAGTPRQV